MAVLPLSNGSQNPHVDFCNDDVAAAQQKVCQEDNYSVQDLTKQKQTLSKLAGVS